MLLGTMMIPGVVTMIPTFILFKQIGWIDSWKPLMIPGMFGAAASIFFLRQFFMTIPSELEDAVGRLCYGEWRQIFERRPEAVSAQQ
jgi:multiple sugar transport system permease protein